LTAEQRGRIVPVKRTDKYRNLSFVKARDGIDRYLPLETRDLLRTKPGASHGQIVDSVKAAFQDQGICGERARALGLRQPWDVLRPSVRDKDALAKWMPWIMVHLGKDNEVVRSSIDSN